MSKESEHKYMHRTEMNLECFVMLNRKGTLPNFKMLILAIPKEGGNDDEMKNFIDKRNKQLSDKIFHQMKEDRELTHKEIKIAQKETQKETQQCIREEIRAMESRIMQAINK
jgi:hypothetical protein